MSSQLAGRLSVDEELEIIARGAEEIFPREELRPKLVAARAQNRPLRVKLGVDPTGSELHIGHAIPVLKLRQFQELGHQAVLIIGDYTATVGDPSGRNKARPQLSHEEVLAHSAHYQEQVAGLLDLERTEVVYNGDWFAKLPFSGVVRLLSQMTLARMLEREDFAKRYAEHSPISLHELVYPLMQGYDSVQVRADVELGAMDQKFNILVGRDLQREAGQEPQIGVCNPVLIGTDGVLKMGKSTGNYIALRDPAEEMYGKVMSIPDALMPMYYELLTDIPLAQLERERVDAAQGRLHPKALKSRLARLVVARFHSAAAAEAAAAAFERVFAQGELPEDIPTFDVRPLLADDGTVWLVKLLAAAELAPSNAEARRLITQGGVRIDGAPQADPNLQWRPQDGAVVQVGKRKYLRIRLGARPESVR
ncbi:MAG TPA: tyrosine--tRNA ligase [Limnochordia bacterium]|nr:tyrosine--tRNA ligase [Limnochordia bacterium]